eukprot:366039-Chlamydomonas_euryale.AAC.15
MTVSQRLRSLGAALCLCGTGARRPTRPARRPPGAVPRSRCETATARVGTKAWHTGPDPGGCPPLRAVLVPVRRAPVSPRIRLKSRGCEPSCPLAAAGCSCALAAGPHSADVSANGPTHLAEDRLQDCFSSRRQFVS